MRLAVYAMTVKGAAALRAAVTSGVDIACVVSGRDQALLEDGYNEIRDIADAAGVRVYGAYPPDIEATHALAAGWRRLLDVPNLVVLHDSLLPRYRGFAPLPTALINGDPHLGVTAILASGAADEGPIVAQLAASIAYPCTILEATKLVLPLYEALTAELLEEWPTGGPPQDESAATYSVWRDELDYLIDWSQPAARIRRKVDALSWPYLGAHTHAVQRVRVVIQKAVEVADVVIEDRSTAVGKILRFDDGDPVVVCGRGLLRLTDTAGWTTSSLRTRFA